MTRLHVNDGASKTNRDVRRMIKQSRCVVIHEHLGSVSHGVFEVAHMALLLGKADG